MNAIVTLVRKEALDMVRDLRLSIFALVYAGLTGIITFFYLRSSLVDQDAGLPPVDPFLLISILGTLNMLFLLVLSGTFILDAVGRERDEGMLGLLLTTRASAGAILLAKVVAALLVYALVFALAMLIAWVLGSVLGPVVPQAMALVFLAPLLVLFVFLLGLGLLLSIVLPSARTAVAVGLAIELVLFIIGATPLFTFLVSSSPLLVEMTKWTPFAVASESIAVVTSGGTPPWAHEAFTLGLGVSALVIGWLVFRAKEVAQG